MCGGRRPSGNRLTQVHLENDKTEVVVVLIQCAWTATQYNCLHTHKQTLNDNKSDLSNTTMVWELSHKTMMTKPDWLIDGLRWDLQIQSHRVLNNRRELVGNDGETMTRVVLTFALHANGKLRNCLAVVHVCNLHITEMMFVSRKHSFKLPRNCHLVNVNRVWWLWIRARKSHGSLDLDHQHLKHTSSQWWTPSWTKIWTRSRFNGFWFQFICYFLVMFRWLRWPPVSFRMHVNTLYRIMTNA